MSSEENLNKDKWFEEQIEPHETSLRAWLRSRFGLESMIDDVVQESYISILKAKEKRKIHTPRAYLFRTARNVAVDLLREMNKHNGEPLEDDSKIVHLHSQRNAKEILQYQQEVELLKAAINALPERCREIFIMRRVYGMPSAQIAKKLGISTHTVSAHLTAGLKKCMQHIENAVSEPTGEH